MATYFTEHARTRMQRGTSSAAIDALLDYGRASHAGDGCEVVYLDKAGRAWRKPTPALRARRAAFAAPTRSSDRTARSSPSATATGA